MPAILLSPNATMVPRVTGRIKGFEPEPIELGFIKEKEVL